MIKLDVILFILGVGIQIYALIDVARKPQETFVFWPKWGWLVIVIIFGLIGSLLWVFWGRAKNGGQGRQGRSRPKRDLPPDDNPDFLRNL